MKHGRRPALYALLAVTLTLVLLTGIPGGVGAEATLQTTVPRGDETVSAVLVLEGGNIVIDADNPFGLLLLAPGVTLADVLADPAAYDGEVMYLTEEEVLSVQRYAKDGKPVALCDGSCCEHPDDADDHIKFDCGHCRYCVHKDECMRICGECKRYMCNTLTHAVICNYCNATDCNDPHNGLHGPFGCVEGHYVSIPVKEEPEPVKCCGLLLVEGACGCDSELCCNRDIPCQYPCWCNRRPVEEQTVN